MNGNIYNAALLVGGIILCLNNWPLLGIILIIASSLP